VYRTYDDQDETGVGAEVADIEVDRALVGLDGIGDLAHSLEDWD
jgi:hypothetical protein